LPSRPSTACPPSNWSRHCERSRDIHGRIGNPSRACPIASTTRPNKRIISQRKPGLPPCFSSTIIPHLSTL
jgi:hypothetical protein